MLRNVGAVLVGLIVGMVVNMAFVMINAYVLFPMPEGLDMNDTVAFGAYIKTLPGQAFILVLFAHLGQSFVGAWLAARLSKSWTMALALLIGVLSLVGGIVNAMQIPLPTWLYIEFPLYLVVAWAAGNIELKRRAAQPA
jgi:hypothetical protein